MSAAPGVAAVACGHPETSGAAARVLRGGGNAFDAAVAAGFAAALAEPMLTSLGGGGFLLARSEAGLEVLFDFFVDTPGRGLPASALEPHFLPMTVHFAASDQVFNIGLGSVAVPGTLAGLLHVHGRLGRLALAEVLAPAIALAREGVVVNERQAYTLELLTPIHSLTERGRRLYAPKGRAPRAGDRLANPELADFLEDLPARGPEALHAGDLAQAVAEEMSAGGGLLTREDLAAYRVIEREPLALEYRGWRILTNPPPAFGGMLIALSLRLLGEADVAPWGSADHLCGLADVMCEVEARRDEVVAEVGARSQGGTTHVSVCDAQGNAASLTLSNGEGSGYLAPGTGIMLNNMLGEDDLHPQGFHAGPPGQRVASMMSPMLLLRDGCVELIVGSGGSKRIRTALLQVISGVVDHGLPLRRAVEAPRLHWDGECIQLEPGFDADAVAALAARHPLNRWPERSLYFGGVHAVDPRGQAAGDPRRGGHGRVLR